MMSLAGVSWLRALERAEKKTLRHASRRPDRFNVFDRGDVRGCAGVRRICLLRALARDERAFGRSCRRFQSSLTSPATISTRFPGSQGRRFLEQQGAETTLLLAILPQDGRLDSLQARSITEM